MKKFSVLGIILVLCCLFVGSVVVAQNAPNVTLERLTITPPSGSSQKYSIKTEIKNNGTAIVTPTVLSVQLSVETADGQWLGKGGMGLIETLAAQETKPVFQSLERKANHRRVKVVLFHTVSSVKLGEKIVSLPLEATPQFEVTCEITPRGYKAVVKNITTTGLSDLVVKGASSQVATLGRWSVAPDNEIKYLPKGEAHEYTGTRTKEEGVVKIMVMHGDVKVTEKVFGDIAPVRPVSNMKKTGTAQ